MTKEPVHVFLGDLHAGSKLAPLVPFTDVDGVQYAPSKLQAFLLTLWRDALTDVKAAVRGCEVVLHLGGDLVDGVGHHGTTQTVLDWNGQRDLAVELLRPWVNIASQGYGLLGTDAHVGDNGQQDTSVCKELGFPARSWWPLEFAGQYLDWAHHISGPRKPWNRDSGAVTLANKTYAECAEAEPRRRVPNLIVRHHMHHFVHARAKGIDVVVVPGWQAQTAFTRRIDPNGLLSTGVVLWWPKQQRVQPLIYPFPEEPIVKGRYKYAKAEAGAAA